MARTDFALVVPYQEISAFGPRLIDAYLRSRGFDAHLIFFKSRTQESCQPTAAETDLLIELLRDLNPRLVGFSLMSPFFGIVTELTGQLRRHVAAPIAFGGVHPTICPEDCIRVADICCLGEGDRPLELLLSGLRETGSPPEDVPNCWLRRGDDIVRNPVTYLCRDLDALPFDTFCAEGRYFIETGRLTREDPYETYIRRTGKYAFKAFRGCPFACTYCGNKAVMDAQAGAGKFHRHRSVDSIIAELTDVRRRFPDLRAVHSYDEVFINDPNYIREFAAKYTRLIGLPLTCDAHLNLLSEETVALMADAGLTQVTVGIEAFSDEVRQVQYKRRGMSTARILEKAAILHRHGVTAHYDFIWDNPLETPDDLRRCFFELILRLPRPLGFNNYSLSFLPGSELTEFFLRQGLIKPENVVGLSDKGLVQWKVTDAYPRPAAVSFWHVMFCLYALSFTVLGGPRGVPRWLLAAIARTESLAVAKTALRAATMVKLAFEGGFWAEILRKLGRGKGR